MKFINDIIRRHVATLRIIPLLAVAAVMLAACGDDDNGTSGNGSSSRQSNNANANPNTREELRLLEFPRVKGDDNNLIIVHSTAQYGINYSIEWDCQKRAQRWTCYEMHKGNNVSNWSRNNWYSTSWNGDPFQEDRDIPDMYNVTLYDHVGDGFDRGHICASQDRMCSREVNEQTFYLSNMQPQYNAFNAGIWADMEGQVRRWNRDSASVPPARTMSVSPQSSILVPRMMAFRADEQAVEMVLSSQSIPTMRAMACVLLPQEYCSVASVPPTVVPEIRVTRLPFGD